MAIETVPLCLGWVAAKGADDTAAPWAVAETGGGVDTAGAIVGAILGACHGAEGVPVAWREARERLPDV